MNSIAHRNDEVKPRVQRKRLTRNQKVSASIGMFAPSASLTPSVSQIKLTPNRGTIRALLDLELQLDGAPLFDIRNVKVIQQDGQTAWVQLPHQQGVSGGWYPIVRCLNPELKRKIKYAALEAFGELAYSFEGGSDD